MGGGAARHTDKKVRHRRRDHLLPNRRACPSPKKKGRGAQARPGCAPTEGSQQRDRREKTRKSPAGHNEILNHFTQPTFSRNRTAPCRCVQLFAPNLHRGTRCPRSTAKYGANSATLTASSGPCRGKRTPQYPQKGQLRAGGIRRRLLVGQV